MADVVVPNNNRSRVSYFHTLREIHRAEFHGESKTFKHQANHHPIQFRHGWSQPVDVSGVWETRLVWKLLIQVSTFWSYCNRTANDETLLYLLYHQIYRLDGHCFLRLNQKVFSYYLASSDSSFLNAFLQLHGNEIGSQWTCNSLLHAQLTRACHHVHLLWSCLLWRQSQAFSLVEEVHHSNPVASVSLDFLPHVQCFLQEWLQLSSPSFLHHVRTLGLLHNALH